MLSKPYSGWSDFKLNGTSTYSLSYLDDIAFEWLDAAMHGLKTKKPFCVKGFMEPKRFLCVVSYYNCYVIIEDEWADTSTKEYTRTECSPTTMVDFCKCLHQDISEYIEEWSSFSCDCFNDEVIEENIKSLQEKLEDFQKMIVIEDNSEGTYL